MNTNNEKYLKEYKHYLCSCNRSSDTIKTYLRVLTQFANRYESSFLNPNQENLIAFFTEPKLSPVTLNGRHNVLKLFYQWMVDSENFLYNPILKILAPKYTKGLPTKIMTKKETEQLLKAVPANKDNYFAYRDRLMMELLYSCSLRRSELVSLNVEDIDFTTHSLRIKAENNKTKTGRIVPIGNFAIEFLKTYLDEVRPEGEQALFKNYKGHRISKQYVTKLVTKLRKQLKLKTKATSHSFRKSSATHMLRNSAPLVSVSKLLGHSDISATQLYTKVYPVDLIKMHRSRHPREKQKNIVLPLLQLEGKLFNVLEQHHPRNWDELPDLRLP